MLAQPRSAIDLPLKALVSESVPGEVTVSFNASTYIIERHSLSAELLSDLVPAERLIAARDREVRAAAPTAEDSLQSVG